MLLSASARARRFPGTISLRPRPCGAADGCGAQRRRRGIKARDLTSNGSSRAPHIAAQKLRRECRLLVFPLNGYRYWNTEKHFGAKEAAEGVHGGAAETSIMLAIAAETVRRAELADFPSLAADMAKRFKHLRPYGRIASFAWQAQDLNPSGAVGNAKRAAAETGEALLAEAAAMLVEILREIDALCPPSKSALDDGRERRRDRNHCLAFRARESIHGSQRVFRSGQMFAGRRQPSDAISFK